MKWFILTSLIVNLFSCDQQNRSEKPDSSVADIRSDTVLVRQKKELNKSYEAGFYSKSYMYYWVAGKDTLDLVIHAAEYEKDSSFHLSVTHKKPVLFNETLERVRACLSLVKDDFQLSKFRSIYFKSPIFYSDLTKKLTAEYEQKFGQRNISYQKLNAFLLQSSLNAELDRFLEPLNKKVLRYGIEKFHLLEKKGFQSYLPGIDLTGYPEFTIHGMGLSISLTEN